MNHETATEFKHTPGPWIVINDEILTRLSSVPICRANDFRDNWESNLKLIAKAPQMLAHLQEIIEELDKFGDKPDTYMSIRRAKSTLKEILGSELES